MGIYKKIEEKFGKLRLRKKGYNPKIWSVIDGTLVGLYTYMAYDNFADGHPYFGTFMAGIGVWCCSWLYNDVKRVIKNHHNKKSDLEKKIEK